jgi:hypothetical protein
MRRPGSKHSNFYLPTVVPSRLRARPIMYTEASLKRAGRVSTTSSTNRTSSEQSELSLILAKDTLNASSRGSQNCWQGRALLKNEWWVHLYVSGVILLGPIEWLFVIPSHIWHRLILYLLCYTSGFSRTKESMCQFPRTDSETI